MCFYKVAKCVSDTWHESNLIFTSNLHVFIMKLFQRM